jgi:UDP-N-acetylglucosamine--N-acetylmuramyl-(pentapeptide) pyrophosphoryl-undecaprenol N-acetylglucosamine transferase
MNRRHGVTGHKPVLIMAGGTGGHVYPALAVARELLRAEVPVIWLGTRSGLEARVIPAAGIPIQWMCGRVPCWGWVDLSPAPAA